MHRPGATIDQQRRAPRRRGGWPVRIATVGMLVAGSAALAGDDGPELFPPGDAAPNLGPLRLVNPTRDPASAPTPGAAAPPSVPVLGPPTLPAATSEPSSPPPADPSPPPAAPAAPGGVIESTPAATRPAPAAAPAGNAVLAMPGLTIPAPSRRSSTLLPMPDLAVTMPDRPARAGSAEPELYPDGFDEVLPGNPRDATDLGAAGDLEPLGPRIVRPMAIPDPVATEGGRASSRAEANAARAASAAPRGRDPGPAKAATPTPAPRRGRFFGLFPGPLAVTPPTLTARSTPAATRGSRVEGDAAEIRPNAAEAALKARIEKQARTYVADRAKAIEVEVDAERRTATVRARGVKFFQKRPVRRALESLPALSGLRSTIEVDD